MRHSNPTLGLLVGGVLLVSASGAGAQDWPQWRGPNRDNKVTGFTAPTTWPKALTQKWKATVGLGESSPALVGDKLYVFGRQGNGGDEMISCLDAASGQPVWQDKYGGVPAVTGGPGQHPGPRSSPAVAEGKVVTFGVGGMLSCLDAATGKVLWRKDSKAWPQFFTASSPIILDGKCIAYLGGTNSGEIVAYDLASGEQKWKWAGTAPGYGSFALMTVDGTKQLVTPTRNTIVAVGAADGKLLWEYPFTPRYNNCTPIVDGSTVIVTGQGTVALKIEKQGDKFEPKELWKKTLSAHQYNTPVLKDGLLFGLSSGRNFFCMDAKTGDTLWTDGTPRGECGEILDAGSVLLALTSDTNLIAFKPSKTGYEELAKIKVADTPPWAYPVVSGKRVFVKDRDSVTLWTLD